MTEDYKKLLSDYNRLYDQKAVWIVRYRWLMVYSILATALYLYEVFGDNP